MKFYRLQSSVLDGHCHVTCLIQMSGTQSACHQCLRTSTNHLFVWIRHFRGGNHIRLAGMFSSMAWIGEHWSKGPAETHKAITCCLQDARNKLKATASTGTFTCTQTCSQLWVCCCFKWSRCVYHITGAIIPLPVCQTPHLWKHRPVKIHTSSLVRRIPNSPHKQTDSMWNVGGFFVCVLRCSFLQCSFLPGIYCIISSALKLVHTHRIIENLNHLCILCLFPWRQ